MEAGNPCWEGPFLHRAMPDTDIRRSSRHPTVADLSRSHGAVRERNHSTLLSTFSAATLVLCVTVAVLAPAVSAEDPLTFHVPGEVTLCLPVNFTWTGGTPPYRLDVEPSVNGLPTTTANQRKTAIETTWVLWTPDFPAGSRLEINVVGSGFTPAAGGFTDVSTSSDSSCLNTASSTTSATSSSPSPSSSAATGVATAVDQPSATSSPAILASSRGGLSKGAIAGIAVAAVLIGIGLIAFAVWYLRRRKNRIQQPERGYDRSIVSPAFSDDAPSTVPYSGLSSTLISVDPNKLYAFTTPPTSDIASSSSGSPDDRDRDPLRARPYLVPRESTADSLSDLHKGGKGSKSEKHVRELSNSNSSAANLSVTTSDAAAHATTASPSQLGSSVNGRDDADADSGDVLRFDADGAARLSTSLSLGSAIGGSLGLGAFSDIGASDVGSNSGEAMLPPPYANYLPGGERIEEE
ncbi:hypothetical protein V8D89_001018 [Ganoderma adspersum]